MTTYKVRSSSTADVKEAANGNEDNAPKSIGGAACDLQSLPFRSLQLL